MHIPLNFLATLHVCGFQQLLSIKIYLRFSAMFHELFEFSARPSWLPVLVELGLSKSHMLFVASLYLSGPVSLCVLWGTQPTDHFPTFLMSHKPSRLTPGETIPVGSLSELCTPSIGWCWKFPSWHSLYDLDWESPPHQICDLPLLPTTGIQGQPQIAAYFFPLWIRT